MSADRKIIPLFEDDAARMAAAIRVHGRRGPDLLGLQSIIEATAVSDVYMRDEQPRRISWPRVLVTAGVCFALGYLAGAAALIFVVLW